MRTNLPPWKGSCNHCGWQGSIEEMKQEINGNMIDLYCPICSEMTCVPSISESAAE